MSSTNRLLALLPAPERERLLGLMRPVKLELKQSLYHAGGPIDSVYFLNRGIASAMTVMEDGSAIEVATIGNEGIVGLGVLFAGGISANEVMMQVAGDGLRLDAGAFAREARDATPLREIVVAYNQAFLTQVSYSVACNGLHSVQQRCCRWILTTRDRTDSDELPLTHEFLGIMLGVRRASVSETLGPLQEQGLLEYRRGMLKILDRPALEHLACECYRKVKDALDALANLPLRTRS